jgi:hypothetical protein
VRRPPFRRGFTIAELVIYMGLVTSALAVFGGISISAQRSLGLQSTLIDMENQAAGYLGSFRRDVEAAKSLEVREDRVLVHRLDGSAVIYRAGERSVLDAEGTQSGREVFGLLRGLSAKRIGGQVHVEARFFLDLYWGQVARTFRRAAAPRREVLK